MSNPSIWTRPDPDPNWRLTEIETSPEIRIGITGHRKLTDIAAIRRALSEVLMDLRPAPDNDALIFFSALAEGADRLAAEAALESGNAVLHAVLPMASADYCEDFHSAESVAEYQSLLDRAAVVKKLEPHAERNASYEAAGRYVVDHCDVLIAVWDGQPARGRGGTAEIVAYARDQGRPMYWIHSRDPGKWTFQDGINFKGE